MYLLLLKSVIFLILDITCVYESLSLSGRLCTFRDYTSVSISYQGII
jgi:hypothetical protein